MVSVANFVIDLISKMALWALNLLPDSPLRFDLGEKFEKYIAYANYFIPFSLMLDTAIAFTAAVAIWYVVRWVLRLAHYIQ